MKRFFESTIFSTIILLVCTQTIKAQVEEIKTSSLPSPAYIFSKYCFDASAKNKEPLKPINSKNWLPLNEEAKAALNLTSDIQAYALQNRYAEELVILAISNFISSKPSKPSGTKCTIITSGIGGFSTRRELRQKFNRAGSTAVIGRQVPSQEGWKQLTWAGYAEKNSDNWQLKYNWLWATTPLFYTKSDLIRVIYKRSEEKNMEVIELNHYYQTPKK